MNRKKLSFIVIALAVLIPVIALVGIMAATPDQFGETFLGELSEKYERLRTVDGEKVVLIGGSNLAFGIDSKKMEETLGKSVVNFGLYATLGTKVMLDLSRSEIGRGDIVVIIPEIDPQTLSMYFNAESMWQACEGDPRMLFSIRGDNIDEMAGGLWGFLSSKIGFAGSDDGVAVSGVYAKSSFDEYGDIVYERPYNQMPLMYDPNKIISLSSETFDDDFIDYVNSYTAFAKRHGAVVYFSFPPMNELAIEDRSDDTLHLFYQFMSDNLDCEVISDVNDYILDAGYFYDSNFHLNDSGVPIRTMQLVEDIMRAEGITDAVEIVYPEIPEVPAKDAGDDVGGDEQLEETDPALFEYDEFGNGLVIVGIKEEASSLDTIVIPRTYDGKNILAIGEGAFKSKSLKKLVIYDNIVQIYNGFLDGCELFSELYVYNTDCTSVSIGSELFSGLSGKPKIYVPYEAIGAYVSDYFWGVYAGMITVIDPPSEE